jgi:hypothetical protein
MFERQANIYGNEHVYNKTYHYSEVVGEIYGNPLLSTSSMSTMIETSI